MSHAYAIALLTPEQAIDPEQALEVLMAPYDEDREVPEYQTPCYCVGEAARKAAREEVQRVHGSHETQRAGSAAALRPHFGGRHYFDLTTDAERDLWGSISETYWAPIRATEAQAFEAHPLKNAPGADCEECNGTGSYPTTRNPMAKWDWYSIGGRWTGVLSGYDPQADPANRETCPLCRGSGKRPETMAIRPDLGCNGCEGKGERAKWATSWKQHDGDIAPVAVVDWTRERMPRAIVHRGPCGWIERGLMGWFGMSDDKLSRQEWHDQARRLLALAAERGDIAVVVDYHI